MKKIWYTPSFKIRFQGNRSPYIQVLIPSYEVVYSVWGDEKETVRRIYENIFPNKDFTLDTVYANNEALGTSIIESWNIGGN